MTGRRHAGAADAKTRTVIALIALVLIMPGAVAFEARASTPPSALDTAGAAPGVETAGSGEHELGHALLVVMDVSGSMAETDDTGTIKLDGAKVALNQLLRAQPPGASVGLWTYPSTGAGEDGCSAGTLLEAVSRGNSTALAATVNALVAGGDTPTGTALRAAVDALKAVGYRQGTVLLVSDGESNCGAPPCEVAADIVDEGFDVTVDAVGFRTSDPGRQELACVSSATGGSYTDVDDSEELADRLAAKSRPALDLRVDGLDRTVSAGTRVVLTATVTNASAIPAKDVRLAVSFLDAGPGTLFPSVVAPRQRLGGLPAGASITRSWAFTAGSPGRGGTVKARLGASGVAVEPVSQTVTVGVSDALLTLQDAGPVLRRAAARGRLAIVGDSYSSGEGAGDYHSGTDVSKNRCHRSSKTYAIDLFKAVDEAVIACSGAVIVNYYGPQDARDGEMGQRFRLADMEPTPDVVLLTFGGNDAGFRDIILRCVEPDNCTQERVPEPSNPHGWTLCRASKFAPLSPPQRQLRSSLCQFTGDPYPDVVLGHIAGLERQLTALYRDISREVNDARDVTERGAVAPVLVLAYPQIFPLNRSTGCANMTADETRFGNRLAAELNGVMARAVAAVQAQEGADRIYFVPDVADAVLPDHSACSQAPYINPFDLATAAGAMAKRTGREQELLHPSPLGYQAMTSSLVQWSQRVPGSGPNSDAILDRAGDRVPAAEKDKAEIGDPDEWDTGPPTETIALDVPLDAQPASVTIGRRIQVTASGFAPGATVRMTMYSAPRTLGEVRADDTGAVAATVPVPPDLPRGEHVLEASGVGSDGDPMRYVRAVDAVSDLPWPIVGVAAASAVAALLGATMLIRFAAASRSRRTTQVGNKR
jgi:lysophospholipase L1-like esterase